MHDPSYSCVCPHTRPCVQLVYTQSKLAHLSTAVEKDATKFINNTRERYDSPASTAMKFINYEQPYRLTRNTHAHIQVR